jgi:hypothetical protein
MASSIHAQARLGITRHALVEFDQTSSPAAFLKPASASDRRLQTASLLTIASLRRREKTADSYNSNRSEASAAST